MTLGTARDLVRFQNARAGALLALDAALASHTPSNGELGATSSAVHVLALLAEQAARALRSGDASEAAVLIGLERQYLAQHAAALLSEGARQLRREAAPSAHALADRLELVLRELQDGRVSSAPSSRRPSSVGGSGGVR